MLEDDRGVRVGQVSCDIFGAQHEVTNGEFIRHFRLNRLDAGQWPESDEEAFQHLEAGAGKVECAQFWVDDEAVCGFGPVEFIAGGRRL